jgi:iron complex outermembrane receptor protein
MKKSKELCLALAAFAASMGANAEEANAPVKTLGSVTVVGKRPTSLPTQIPTTIEGISGEEIAEKINATDAEDALKYFPSLLVRKRYVGDYDHAVLASRASGTGNSARSLVYADGILLSNLLGNGATFTPRWGLVTPEEIERVDVLYGPFSAAYSGNSVGAVVDYVTRMPEKFEAHTRVTAFGQRFDLHGTEGRYGGNAASASVGNRNGNLSWWINYNRLESESQPLVFANKLVSAGAQSSAGTPVTGAVRDRSPTNQDRLLIGATNFADTVQDHAKAKLAYDFTSTLRATYILGFWRNEVTRTSQSYLRDAAGNPVFGDLANPNARELAINVDGRRYTLTPSDFATRRESLEHLMHGLTLRTDTQGAFDWEVAASLYDYANDEVRQPTVFVADANTRGAGRITELDGTGWNTLALKGIWRPTGVEGDHLVDFGFQRDSARLRQTTYNAADWISGRTGQRVDASRGETRLTSLYAQDTWAFAPRWRATLGGRLEDWRAFDGSRADSQSDVAYPEREDRYFSPKAALAYQLTAQWALKASAGRAVRMPTVAELFQGSIFQGNLINNDPSLAPERSWTSELSAERSLARGSLRTTVFYEDTRDALYSQRLDTATGSSVTTVQNVGKIRTRGLEVAFNQVDAVIVGLDLSSSVTYADSRVLANENFPASVGQRQPRVPEWRANLLASYRVGEAWTLTLGGRYSGKQFNQLDNADTNGDAYTGVSDFIVLDARVRYRMTEKIVAAVSIDNLNNATYWAFHPYPQRTVAAELNVDF